MLRGIEASVIITCSIDYGNQLSADVDASRLHEFPIEHMDGLGFGLGVAVRTQPD